VTGELELTVGRYTVKVTHPDKLVFPKDGFTKRDLALYYHTVGPHMLPHIRGRPLVLHRFPDGIDRPGFIQQEADDYFPKWVQRVTVSKVSGGTITHPMVGNVAALVYLTNLGTVTIHNWLSRADRPRVPDRLIFDLDPPDDDFGPVRSVATLLREVLQRLGLPPFIMTTGSRGAHVVVPIQRNLDFDDVRAFADRVAGLLAARYSKLITIKERVEERAGRLYIDTKRNAYGQTAVAPYAVRAKPGAPVATPVDWSEIDEPGFTSRRYNIREVPARLADRGDPWANLDRHAGDLMEARRKLDRLNRR